MAYNKKGSAAAKKQLRTFRSTGRTTATFSRPKPPAASTPPARIVAKPGTRTISSSATEPKTSEPKVAWKERTAKAATPAAKQAVLVKRASKVGSIGKKAKTAQKALVAKKKTGSLTAAEQTKLTNIQARRKAARSSRKKATPRRRKVTQA